MILMMMIMMMIMMIMMMIMMMMMIIMMMTDDGDNDYMIISISNYNCYNQNLSNYYLMAPKVHDKSYLIVTKSTKTTRFYKNVVYKKVVLDSQKI